MLQQGIDQGSRLGLALNFDLVNQDVLRFTAIYNDEWWNALSKTTRNRLRDAIQANIASGAPQRQLVKDITPLFGKDRAKLIASTETTRLYTEGNMIAYRADPTVTRVEWMTVGDERVCRNICEPLTGDQFDKSATFEYPPAHPACRCWLAPVVEGKAITKPSAEPTFDVLQTAAEKNAWIRDEGFRNPLHGWVSPSEQEALRFYKGGGGFHLNAYLRNPLDRTLPATSRDWPGIAKQLDAALTRHTVNRPIVVYRGVPGEVLGDAKVGDVLLDRGFLSTTLDRNLAAGGRSGFDVLFEIRVPKGQQALWLEPGSPPRSQLLTAGGEEELLLPRNLVLRIVEMRENTVVLEVVPVG